MDINLFMYHSMDNWTGRRWRWMVTAMISSRYVSLNNRRTSRQFAILSACRDAVDTRRINNVRPTQRWWRRECYITERRRHRPHTHTHTHIHNTQVGVLRVDSTCLSLTEQVAGNTN